MRLLLGVLVLCAAIVPMPAERIAPKTNHLVVSLQEGQIDLSPRGVTSNDCMIVRTDGMFHLERRWQQLPSSSAVLHVYESLLNRQQMQELTTILAVATIRDLPDFTPPHIPGNPSLRRAFQATIVRPTGVQRVGYVDWPGRDQGSAPESLQISQQKAAVALVPLVNWFHGIMENMKPSQSSPEVTLCELD